MIVCQCSVIKDADIKEVTSLLAGSGAVRITPKMVCDALDKTRPCGMCLDTFLHEMRSVAPKSVCDTCPRLRRR